MRVIKTVKGTRQAGYSTQILNNLYIQLNNLPEYGISDVTPDYLKLHTSDTLQDAAITVATLIKTLQNVGIIGSYITAPAFTDTTLASAYPGVSYSDGVSASNGGGTLVYAITSGSLPAGLSFNTTTGAITGTPTTLGVYTFTISATNAAGTATTGTLTITTSVNTFTQSVGANRISNGNFASGLTGWNSVGSPTTLEVVGGRLHVIGSANAGVSTAALFSPQLALGVYEVSYDVQVVSGTFTLQSPSNTAGYVASHNAGVNQTFYALWSPPSVVGRGSLIAGGSGAGEFYLDNHVVAPVTQNPTWTTQSANGTHTLSFTLPASPQAGQRIDLRYRQQDALNYWAAVIVRNSTNTAWDVRLDSVNAGGATIRLIVQNVGAVDAMRVTTSGDIHSVSTGVGGVFTPRGSTLFTHLNTQTGITAVYSSAFTALGLVSDSTVTTQLNVSTFTQTLGSNILVDGDMEAGNTDAWGQLNNATLTKETAAPYAGTRNLRVAYSISVAPLARQTSLLTAGNLYEIQFAVRSSAAHETRVQNNTTQLLVSSSTSWVVISAIFRATNTDLWLVANTSSAGYSEFDAGMLRLITPNTVWTMPSANGTYTLSFTLPVSPIAGQRIEMPYRKSGGNYWRAVLIRNTANTNYDARIEVVASEAPTTMVSALNVGNCDTLCVVALGNSHTLYTGVSGAFTSRGSTANSSYAAQFDTTAVYSSAIAPVRLVVL